MNLNVIYGIFLILIDGLKYSVKEFFIRAFTKDEFLFGSFVIVMLFVVIGSYINVCIAIIISFIVSLILAALKFDKNNDDDEKYYIFSSSLVILIIVFSLLTIDKTDTFVKEGKIEIVLDKDQTNDVTIPGKYNGKNEDIDTSNCSKGTYKVIRRKYDSFLVIKDDEYFLECSSKLKD